MKTTARLLAPLAVFFFVSACRLLHPFTSKPTGRSSPSAASDPLPAGALLPSHNLLVGRVIAVDVARHFAFVELAADAPAPALADGAELTTRTDALRETARLRASRYVRGRTLGTNIVAGQPTPGDEVVFPAP